MNVRLANRLGNQIPARSVLALLIDRAGYVILAFVALWASARFSEWSEQFIALAIILGWKWICGSQVQVIQIFTHDEKEYQ